jgi:type IV secretory pathway TraG/TraD family ATPase VirD4
MFLVSACFSEAGYGVRMLFGWQSFALLMLVVAVAILVSWVVSLFTEAKTAELRAAVLRHLEKA